MLQPIRYYYTVILTRVVFNLRLGKTTICFFIVLFQQKTGLSLLVQISQNVCNAAHIYFCTTFLSVAGLRELGGKSMLKILD